MQGNRRRNVRAVLLPLRGPSRFATFDPLIVCAQRIDAAEFSVHVDHCAIGASPDVGRRKAQSDLMLPRSAGAFFYRYGKFRPRVHAYRSAYRTLSTSNELQPVLVEELEKHE